MVRRISLGITTLPRSSILLTIPVAFILYLSPCFQFLPCYCLSEFAVYTKINFNLNNVCYSLIFRFIQKSKSEKIREKTEKTHSIKSKESDKLEFVYLIRIICSVDFNRISFIKPNVKLPYFYQLNSIWYNKSIHKAAEDTICINCGLVYFIQFLSNDGLNA